MKYDVVIVGAGLAGATCARLLAEKTENRILVVERRNHIAGNCYDEYDKNGVLVQIYGPHYVVTDSWAVMDFLQKFDSFYECPERGFSCINGKYINRPYNLKSLQQLMGPENTEKISRKLKAKYGLGKRVSLFELLEDEDEDISKCGELLRERIYIPYVLKQWGLKIEEISKDVVNLAEFIVGYDTQLEDWDYQYLPEKGFTNVIRNMLEHPQISVELGKDAKPYIGGFEEEKLRWDGNEIKEIIYTGSLDELFDFRYGGLNYRSRKFSYIEKENGFMLPSPIVTYPDDEEFIRRTEFNQFTKPNRITNVSVIQNEYSIDCIRNNNRQDEPYYPIINDQNIDAYNKYLALTKKYTNLHLCGRLAEYKYLNMDVTILSAMRLVESII